MRFILYLLLLAASLFSCRSMPEDGPSSRGLDNSAWTNQIKKQSREIEKHPNWAEPYQLRGFAFYNLGKFRKAYQDFSAALKQDPNYLLAQFNRGMSLIRLKRLDSAKADFQHILTLDSTHARSHFQLGYINYHRENYDTALLCLNKAIDLDPDYKTARHFRAATFYRLGMEDGAVQDLTLILYDSPHDPVALTNRGLSQLAMKEWEYALVDIKKALDVDSTFSQAWYYRGLAEIQGGKFHEAIQSFTQAIRLDPNNAYYYFQRGMAKQNIGRHAEARADFDQAMLKNPQFDIEKEQKESASSNPPPPLDP